MNMEDETIELGTITVVDDSGEEQELTVSTRSMAAKIARQERLIREWRAGR